MNKLIMFTKIKKWLHSPIHLAATFFAILTLIFGILFAYNFSQLKSLEKSIQTVPPLKIEIEGINENKEVFYEKSFHTEKRKTALTLQDLMLQDQKDFQFGNETAFGRMLERIADKNLTNSKTTFFQLESATYIEHFPSAKNETDNRLSVGAGSVYLFYNEVFQWVETSIN